MDLSSLEQQNWAELDDEAWRKLLEDMASADTSSWNTIQNQETYYGNPTISKYADSLDDQRTRHDSDTNAGRYQGYPGSPPGYVTLLSAEASPDAEPVPQAVSEEDYGSTLEGLRRLVHHLQRE